MCALSRVKRTHVGWEEGCRSIFFRLKGNVWNEMFKFDSNIHGANGHLWWKKQADIVNIVSQHKC